MGTNDLSNALELSSAGMATYNNTIEQTIGLVTAGTEIMVGRSLICGLRKKSLELTGTSLSLCLPIHHSNMVVA